MTSFAFIFGLFPLVIAEGAGALTRHAVGTPVFGGMIAASVFGIFLIPLLFITAERLRQRGTKKNLRSSRRDSLEHEAETAPPADDPRPAESALPADQR